MSTASEEKRQKIRDQTKIRNRHYRAKHKEERYIDESDERKAKWREAKSKWFRKMTPQQKQERNMKRREEYAKKKLAAGKIPRTACNVGNQVVAFPGTPHKYARVVYSFLEQATPRKRRALKKHSVFFGKKLLLKHRRRKFVCARLRNEMIRLKYCKKKAEREKLKVLISTVAGRKYADLQLCKAFKQKWNTWVKYSDCSGTLQVPRKTSIDHLAIKEMYVKMATPLAQKNSVAKDGTQKAILNTSIRKIHQQFSMKNKVSLSSFVKLRPKHILTVDKHKFSSCLCEVCLNVSNQVRPLLYCAKSVGITLPFKDKFEASELTMCPKGSDQEKYHKIECIKRECPDCGPKLLMQLDEVRKLTKEKGSTEVMWKKWKSVRLEPGGNKTQTNPSAAVSGASKSSVTKKVLTEQVGTVDELLDTLANDLKQYPLHLFNANYQQSRYEEMKEHLPKGSMITVEDFAENWRSKHQDEIQAAHYSYNQATLLTKVSHFHCPECGEAMKESAVFISEDLKHDSHFVHECHKMYNEHLHKNKVDIAREVVFSDGCASQFKGKLSFHYLTQSKSDLGHHQERAFFGTRHGKSECDPLGGAG